MKSLAFKASALAMVTLGSSAFAQTTVGPSNIAVAFYTEGNNFFVDPPGATPPMAQVQSAGATVLNVTGYGSVYDFCSEFFVGRNETLTYNVTSGLGSLSTIQQANVKALLSNALPTLESMVAAYQANVGLGNWDGDPAQRAQLNAYGAAIQIALWEIVSDTSPILEADNSKPDKGIFAVDLTVPGTSATVLQGENLGITFVNNVKSGIWTDQGGMVYYYADSPNQQDRIWAQVVPETSSALLGLVGFGLLARRRRN